MKKSIDLFGQALLDRYNGEIYPFFIEIKKEKQEHKLDRYFRSVNELSKIENKLISMCYGNILDVGCGTGNYIPAMKKMGKVIGIDISPKVIELSKKMGIKNCFVADIFSYDEQQKFDTITFFENNLGMGGTLDGTKKLLKKISNLLTEDGQLLIILAGNIKSKNFVESELVPIYREIKGRSFRWINFNTKYLSNLCTQENLSLKTLSGNKYYSLIKITKKY